MTSEKKTASEILHDLLEDYEFRGDTDHVPTDGERTMLEDFGLGLIEALKDATLLPPVAPAGDREAVARRWYQASDPEVEPVAQAIWDAQEGDKTPWQHLFEAEQREYRAMAIAALNASPSAQPAEERAIAALIEAVQRWAGIEPSRATTRDIALEAAWEAYNAALSRARTGSEAQNG